MKSLFILIHVGSWLLLSFYSTAQINLVKYHQKISNTEGNFTAILDDSDFLGYSSTSIGDFNKDGVNDLAVGAYGDDDGGGMRGSLYILLLQSDGTVKSSQKISDLEGNFNGTLEDLDRFGISLSCIGDLNGDAVVDLAVGATFDNDGGSSRGAVWILFLNADGTVQSEAKISDTQGGFTGALDKYDNFGVSIAAIGDLDNDNVMDIAVGAHADDDGGTNRGAVWILFLKTDGSVKSYQKISSTQGNFLGMLTNANYFANAIAPLGDLNGDAIEDIAVGAYADSDGGAGRGAVWILFLNTDGTVKSSQKISNTQGGFTGVLYDSDQFGSSVANIGDINNDAITDIAVGAITVDDGGMDRGAIWLLLMNSNGTVNASQKISDTEGNFNGVLDDADLFGESITNIGDINGGGMDEIAIGADRDGDGGYNRGAVWILFFDTVCDVHASFSMSDTALCVGDTITITNTSIGGTTYEWNVNDTLFFYYSPLKYVIKDDLIGFHVLLNVANANCKDSIEKDVIIHASPLANAGNDTTIEKGNKVNLTISGNASYTWFTLDSSSTCVGCSSFEVSPPASTMYYLMVEDSNGCISMDSIYIEVLVDTLPSTTITENEIHVYNCFTPNNDGINDEFRPEGENIKQYQLLIFNRWGTKVYESNDLSIGWNGIVNGQKLPTATYYYLLHIVYTNDEQESLNGFVSLID